MKNILLQSGELYAGVILGKDGNKNYHLVLLPQKSEPLTWEGAIEWANSLGADLPTRQEQAVLFGNLNEEFEKEFYWSSECAAGPDFAWVQDFDNGYQSYYHESCEYRALAVRRLLIIE